MTYCAVTLDLPDDEDKDALEEACFLDPDENKRSDYEVGIPEYISSPIPDAIIIAKTIIFLRFLFIPLII